MIDLQETICQFFILLLQHKVQSHYKYTAGVKKEVAGVDPKIRILQQVQVFFFAEQLYKKQEYATCH
jgi:hypothetical protein